MAICPKCGVDLTGNEIECPSCGVILAKARPRPPRPVVVAEPPPLPAPPSLPVPPPLPPTVAQSPSTAVKELKGNTTKERVLACMIDNLLASIFALAVAARFPLDAVTGGPVEDPFEDALVRWMLAGLAYFIYFFVPEGIWGTTPGKRLFGLRVVRLDGKPAGAWEAWWRTVLRVFEANPLLLGYFPGALVVACSARKQRLGDMVAGTVVVRRETLTPEHALGA